MKSLFILILCLLAINVGAQCDTSLVKPAPVPMPIQVGITENFYLEIPSDQNVAMELLYTVTRPSDSTQTQWMVDADGGLQFRKLDAEIRVWSEWIKIPKLLEFVPPSGRRLTLNGSHFDLRTR